MGRSRSRWRRGERYFFMVKQTTDKPGPYVVNVAVGD